MSSLAAAKADNFYYAPGFDPDKHKTLNKFNGQHPLRDRARKLDKGILVIRFEVPFNLFCSKCGEMIAQGVRFNAEKKQVGNYHSTKILSFSMRHHCGSIIVIETDPKNAEYIVKEGARRKAEDYTAADAEVLELAGDEERTKLAADPLFRLEHNLDETKRVEPVWKQLAALKDIQDSRYTPAMNSQLRAAFRKRKKQDAQTDARRKELGLSDAVTLLPEAPTDALTATLTFFNNDSGFKKSQRNKRRTILSESIFLGGDAPEGEGSAGRGGAGDVSASRQAATHQHHTGAGPPQQQPHLQAGSHPSTAPTHSSSHPSTAPTHSSSHPSTAPTHISSLRSTAPPHSSSQHPTRPPRSSSSHHPNPPPSSSSHHSAPPSLSTPHHSTALVVRSSHPSKPAGPHHRSNPSAAPLRGAQPAGWPPSGHRRPAAKRSITDKAALLAKRMRLESGVKLNLT